MEENLGETVINVSSWEIFFEEAEWIGSAREKQTKTNRFSRSREHGE